MTEEDAKTKQCPMVQGKRPTETKCIASDCMMWQWAHPIPLDGKWEGDKWCQDYSGTNIKQGYCGLAK